MNTVYKVIWSKAKNCYVVASEIARSHTKSATGSEKMGRYGKRALLALAAATAIVCGGFVNVGATVHVDEVTGGANEIYTTAEVNTELGKKADANNVYTKGQTYTKDEVNTELGKKADANNVYTKDQTYTKDEVNTELGKKADANNVYTKDQTYTKDEVNTELGKKADANNVYTKAEVDGKFATSDALTTAKTDLEGKITTAKTELEGKINANETAINDLKTKATATETTLTDLSGRMTTAESDIDSLQADMATAKSDINSLKGDMSTAKSDITDLKTKDTELSGKIDANKAAIDQNKTDITQNKNDIATINGKLTTAEGNITNNKNAIDDLNTKVGTVNNGTYLDSSKSVGENLNKLNDGLVQEVADRTAADNALSDRINANANTIANVNQELVNTNNHFNTELGKTNTALQEEGKARANADAALDAKIGTNADNIKANKDEIARVNGELVKTNDHFNAELTKTNDHFNTELGKTNAALQEEVKARAEADAKINTKIGNIDDTRTEYVKDANSISQNLTKLDEELQKTNDRTGGVTRNTEDTQTTIEGTVKVDNQGNIKDVKNLGAETVTTGKLDVTGDSTLKNTKVNGTLETTGKATFDDDVTMKKDLTVEGKLNVGEISMSNTKTDSDGTIHNSATTITADSMTNNASIKKNGQTTESQFTHTEEGTFNYAHQGDSTDWKEATSNVTADGVANVAKDSQGNNNTFTQTSKDTKNTLADKDGNTSSTRQDGKGIYGYAKDTDGNKSYTKQEGNRIAESVIGQDGKETKSEMTSIDITNTAKDGTITNDAKDIVNKASGDMTNTVGGNLKNEVTGNIENSATNITNTTTGDMTNTIGGKLTTTVTGATEENYNGGLRTNVTGEEDHTVTGNQNNKVTGKQTNTVEGGQENIISGGQTNTITGGQINNITGDQTTTITGNKEETVTENVTEDYKKDLTTTVGGNEIHDVKGTKTETVEGKVTENFKGGQETNVTGDQTTNVSGTQTTNATDINRNASSGMIDTVDNAYGTNKETKVAGSTTTKVSIKGTGESGTYIRGATEARDYIIKGTLSNSETKTAETTSTEITDGNGKTSSTIQDVTQISGSVTDGTNMAVSNVKADSIDSAVAGGTDISTINQKKDSIISQVSDGTTATKTEQTAKDITNMAQDGTITNNAKNIVNRATGAIENSAKNITNTATDKITDQVGSNTRVTDTTSITDTVGTASRKTEDGKITDTAGDSTVITENGEGTTFKKTGSTAYGEGGPTDTNISGNLIQTGRIESNELNVSDKDGDNTADLNVKAGAGVTASASDGNTTGSLDVKANEVGSSVKDAAGNGSDFRQRIDAIVGKVSDGTTETKTEQGVKDITNTATDGTIKNDAKDIENKASNSMTETVGGTNVTKKTAKSTKSTIENSDVTTAIEQTDEQIQTSVIKKDGSASNVSTDYANASANRVTEDGQTSTVINNKNGLLIQNSDNQTSFTTENGTSTGAAQGWTNIKGNEISTGKVEANYVKMGYADVMKDLGVRGNANIAGKTTTGELEVTGTSTLRGDVTMEGNATVKKDLTVEGTTTTKDLQVTNNATIGGTLDVAGKSNFHDDVIMDKNLTVGGNVDAGSFTVKGTDIKIDQDGINAGGLPITNVGDGSVAPGSKDVVNGGQLYNVKTDLEGKVNKVGANAAAMANLHPMEFDPDSKWNIAAAMGNYGSETATAMGLFYRPNEDVMVNLSTAFGTGENMVGGGVSVRLGQGGNKLTRKENNELKAQVNDLTARMDALLSVLNPNMSKDFPDVPENHWAYEAVSRLAGNDIVQGYPDGEFHGERTMTRYEMAEIIYKALSRGAEAEKKLVDEFKPELQAMAASNKATAEAPVSEAE